MAKQSEKARQAIATQCEPGEQVRTVGLFWKGGIAAVLLFWQAKTYWIGVTDKRLILLRLDAMSQPVYREATAVPLSAVKLNGSEILVKLPDSEKAEVYKMRFGLKSATGFDINEFKAAL